MHLPRKFLFRFRFPCHRAEKPWTSKGCQLDESFRLPDLAGLECPDKTSVGSPFDFRLGWNEKGLLFSLEVHEKKQRPWCRSMHPEESDGLQICLDTRDMKDIHRATRFCHRLVFLPLLNSVAKNQPDAIWLPIHRAKGHPNPIELERIKLTSRLLTDGYRLDAFLPGDILTGFAPQEHPSLGFHFVLVDRELGNRYFLVEPPFPQDQDPSLWGTLELV